MQGLNYISKCKLRFIRKTQILNLIFTNSKKMVKIRDSIKKENEKENYNQLIQIIT